jgi:mannose-6-phosphate isomerase-like protein (cupin superfamily)
MSSPQGWFEPPQTPEFNEVTFVLAGEMHVNAAGTSYLIKANEAFIAEAGETVQYSTPSEGGAEYIAICVPAFSPDSVHREE